MKRLGWLLVAVAATACGPASTAESPSASAGATGGAATASASVSASPSASASSMAASPSASAGADDLQLDSVVEVVVTDLVVRSHAGLAAPSTILPDRLRAPDRALVVDGPRPADGYSWYLVAPLSRPDGTVGPVGWIARGSREGEPWVRAVSVACPDDDDLGGIIGLQPLERLACFGARTLTLTAPVVSCGAGGGPWTYEPAWLNGIGGCGLAPDTSGERVLLVRTPPGETEVSSGPATVTGHFDDPASSTCRITSADPATPAPSDEEAVVLCRTQFVQGPGSGS